MQGKFYSVLISLVLIKLAISGPLDITKSMGIGINLGNTFEAFGCGDGDPSKYYTCWGSPKITQKMIQGYKDLGFKSLRVPVHWFNMMASDYTPSQDYIKVVKEVVDWALQAGLYVIVNLHHDNDVLFKNWPNNKETSMKNYKTIWTTVAKAFREYDDHLILESLNEEGCWDSIYNRWGDGSGKSNVFNLLNEINQAFVDLVRKDGGNNAKRTLLIAGYCTDFKETSDSAFKMPSDPANNMAVSVHYYNPSTFTILTADADWGKVQKTWGTDAEVKELNSLFDMVKNAFISKGFGVIVGEFGTVTEGKDMNSVRKYLTTVAKAASSRGMAALLWDTPGGFYDRNSCKFTDAELLKGLTGK